MRVAPLGVVIDRRIAGRDYQQDCIETLCREIGLGRRKLLVEMATGPPGAWWDPANAQSILNLRCLRANHRWTDSWMKIAT